MSAIAIASRELRERSRLLMFAGALAVLPFIAAVLPGVRTDRADVIAAVSSFLALALSLGSAVAFGSSTVARDLSERRMSFYFSKPVSPAAIWIGKAAASLIASYACFVIIALPAALAARKVWPMLWMMTPQQLLIIVGGGVAVLFFVSHLLSSMIRSRSILIALDFALLAVAAAIVVVLGGMLLTGGAVELTAAVGVALAIAVAIIVAVAPVRQLAQGRTDLRRSHAALSRFLWPAVFAVIGIAAAYVLWVVSASPDDLSAVLYVEQPASAQRLFVGGSTKGRRDYHGTFLMDANGGWKRIRSAAWSEVSFARNGSTVVWFEPVGFVPRSELELYTERGATGIRAHGYAEVAVSDDGSRIALGKGSLVTVYDLASGRMLASAGGFDGARRHSMFFVNNDLLRVVEYSYRFAGVVKIHELDVPRKKLALTGTTDVAVNDSVIASSDGRYLVLRKTRRVIDGRTGATIAQLPPSSTPAAGVLRDGRALEIPFDGKTATLRVTGGPDVPLPGAGVAQLAGELADGTLLISGAKTRGWSPTGADRMVFIVDPIRGAVVRTIRDMKGPQSRWWASDPRLVRFDAPKLYGVDREGKLTWWDPKG